MSMINELQQIGYEDLKQEEIWQEAFTVYEQARREADEAKSAVIEIRARMKHEVDEAQRAFWEKAEQAHNARELARKAKNELDHFLKEQVKQEAEATKLAKIEAKRLAKEQTKQKAEEERKAAEAARLAKIEAERIIKGQSQQKIEQEKDSRKAVEIATNPMVDWEEIDDNEEFNGIIRLQVLSPVRFAQEKELTSTLSQISGIKLLCWSGSINGGQEITLSVEKPLPLAINLKRTSLIKRVVKNNKKLGILLN